jgi:hypothetical protein
MKESAQICQGLGSKKAWLSDQNNPGKKGILKTKQAVP